MKNKHYLIVYNPQSGSKAQYYINKVRNELNNKHIEFELFATTGNLDDDENILNPLIAKSSDVISIGGDGTLNLLCNVLAGKDVPLGIIPCGTGNDFSRNLYKGEDEVIDIVLGSKTSHIDLGWCNDRYFINVLGVGYDAMVAKASFTTKKIYFRSLFYFWNALKFLPFYKEEVVETQSNVLNKNEPTFLMAFGNGAFYGGGMNITPHADITDGLLDCCWVGKLSFYKKIKCLLKIFSGNHLNEDNIEYYKAKEFKVVSKHHPIEADGEFIGYSPATIKIAEKMLILKVG